MTPPFVSIRRWGLGLGFLLGSCFRAYASPGTDSAAFLNIPVGAGPAALGSAYSALATDAYAPVWNPGGLSFLDSTQIAAQHVSYLESISYEYLSFARPIAPGDSLGFAAQYVGSGNIPAIDNTGVSQGSYSDEFGAYSLAYGHAFTDRFGLGITGKLIHIKLSDISANAYATDLGSLWRVSDHVNLAAVVSNIGTSLRFLDSSDPLPLAFRFGAAYAPSRYWILTGETVFPRTGLVSGRFGAEWRPVEFLALRAGYRTDTLKGLSAVAGVSTGFGLQVWGHEFAYAWVPYGELGNSQYVSLVLRFGGPENRNLIQYQHTKFESGDTSSLMDGGATTSDDARYRRTNNTTAEARPQGSRSSR